MKNLIFIAACLLFASKGYANDDVNDPSSGAYAYNDDIYMPLMAEDLPLNDVSDPSTGGVACQGVADIGVIMDASGSVSPGNFNIMKDFVAKLTEDYEVGPQKTHFGIIRYDTNPTLIFPLNNQAFWQPNALVQRIKNIRYTGGGTQTDRALAMARDKLFCSTCGARKQATKMLLVMTDGQSGAGPVPLNVLSDQLGKLGVTVIAIGIGSGVNTNELKLIASEDKFVYQVTNFAAMLIELDKLVKLTCQIKHCQPNPCKNNGVCQENNNDYKCTCKPGFTGKQCQTNKDECKPNPCKNGAQCTDLVNGYKCTCKPGFQGNQCQTNIDECKPNPCKNGAKCTDLVNGYKCTCVPGFNGKQCQTNIDECKPNPCKNGAQCTDLVNDYKCTCKPGFQGKQCQTNKDECKPNPCKNGAQCTDLINGYKCTCKPGFQGNQCQTNIDECKPNPCKNGANCTDLINGYKCTCEAGFNGKQCQTNINECKPNPCKNGGRCTDLVNDFKCACKRRYDGKSCMIDKCKGFQQLTPRRNFIIADRRATYRNAVRGCRRRGGHLATIRNEAENKIVQRMLLERGIAAAFIGLKYNFRQKNYDWASNELACYLNWRPLNPNKMNFVAFYSCNGKWADVHPRRRLFYICQK